MTTITSKDELKPLAIGGSVTLIKRAAEFDVRSGTVLIFDGAYDIGDGARWQYHVKGTQAEPLPTAPVVIAPPPPPPPPVDTDTNMEAVATREAFQQSDTTTIGLNEFAGIGTIRPAPDGFRTDFDRPGNPGTGLLRVGFYNTKYDDVILQGRAIEGFSVFVDGKRYANIQLTGFTQIPGKFIDAKRWIGSVAGIDIVQHARLNGDKVSFDIELTNNAAGLRAVGYVRSADPDQSDLYNTTNTAVAGGVECLLQGVGGKFYLRDLAGKATVRTAAYNKAADLGTALAVGKTIKGDYVVQLVFAAVNLEPGQSVTHSFEMGIIA